MAPVIGILAAGGSSRMRGRDKLLEKVGDRTLLAHQVANARATGHRVLVAVPVAPHPRLAEIEGADPVEVADAAEGMAASIRALVRALPPRTPSLLLLLADMPEIDTTDLLTMLRAADERPGRILRGATEDGRSGHPVVLPARCFADLVALHGDRGAQELLRRDPQVDLIPLPGRHAILDLDTPEDWEAWRGGG